MATIAEDTFLRIDAKIEEEKKKKGKPLDPKEKVFLYGEAVKELNRNVPPDDIYREIEKRYPSWKQFKSDYANAELTTLKGWGEAAKEAAIATGESALGVAAFELGGALLSPVMKSLSKILGKKTPKIKVKPTVSEPKPKPEVTEPEPSAISLKQLVEDVKRIEEVAKSKTVPKKEPVVEKEVVKKKEPVSVVTKKKKEVLPKKGVSKPKGEVQPKKEEPVSGIKSQKDMTVDELLEDMKTRKTTPEQEQQIIERRIAELYPKLTKDQSVQLILQPPEVKKRFLKYPGSHANRNQFKVHLKDAQDFVFKQGKYEVKTKPKEEPVSDVVKKEPLEEKVSLEGEPTPVTTDTEVPTIKPSGEEVIISKITTPTLTAEEAVAKAKPVVSKEVKPAGEIPKGKKLTNEDIFEMVNSIKPVPFDKTGTTIKFKFIADSDSTPNLDAEINRLRNEFVKKAEQYGLKYNISDVRDLDFPSSHQKRITISIKKPKYTEEVKPAGKPTPPPDIAEKIVPEVKGAMPKELEQKLIDYYTSLYTKKKMPEKDDFIIDNRSMTVKGKGKDVITTEGLDDDVLGKLYDDIVANIKEVKKTSEPSALAKTVAEIKEIQAAKGGEEVKGAIPKELEQEIGKYKSAEEFVKAQLFKAYVKQFGNDVDKLTKEQIEPLYTSFLKDIKKYGVEDVGRQIRNYVSYYKKDISDILTQPSKLTDLYTQATKGGEKGKATIATPTQKLPADLSKATPRYNYGSKAFMPQFESDIDKALYITAQTKKSIRDADYREFLKKQGFTDKQIYEYGNQVRTTIKSKASLEKGGTIKKPQSLTISDNKFIPVSQKKGEPQPRAGGLPHGELKLGVGEKIVGRESPIRIDKDTQITDIHGNRVVLPEGEEYTPFLVSKDGKTTKYILQDGERRVVTKGTLEKVVNQNTQLGAGRQPMAGGMTRFLESELKQVKDRLKSNLERFKKEAEKKGMSLEEHLKNEKIPLNISEYLLKMDRGETSIAPKQLRFIHALRGRTKISDDEYRQEISRITNNRATSSKDLTTKEATMFIERLQAIATEKGVPSTPTTLSELVKEIKKEIAQKQIAPSSITLLRKALKIPKKEATAEDLRTLLSEIKKLQKGDIIVSPKTQKSLKGLISPALLEEGVVTPEIQTNLAGILSRKYVTKREIQDLVDNMDILHNRWIPAQYGKLGNPMIRSSQNLLFDTYETTKRELHKWLTEVDDLINRSRRSRKSGIVGKIVPQDKEVIEYLQNQRSWDTLTPDEQNLALFLKRFWEDTQKLMAKDRKRQGYVPHVKRGLMEAMKEDKTINIFKILKEGKDLRIDPEMYARYDDVLANEKFSPFGLPRTADMPYSKDLMRITEEYGRLYFTKKNFDPIMPTIIAVKHITRFPKAADFITSYAKSLQGTSLNLKEPATLKKVVNGLITYGYWRFLAFNFDAGIVNTMIGKMESFISQSMPNFFRGEARFMKKRGQEIIKEVNLLDEHAIEQAVNLFGGIGGKVQRVAFYNMRGGGKIPWGENWIQGSYFLGELTEAEFKGTVKITNARIREIFRKIANIQGPYRMTERPLAAQDMYTRIFTNFKLWMFGKIGSRIRRYKATFSPSEMKTSLSTLKLNSAQKSTVKEMALTFPLLWVFLSDEMPDEIKDSYQKIFADFYSYLDLSKWEWTTRTAAPSLTTLADIMGTLDSMIKQDRYLVGERKGELKAKWEASRLLPRYPTRLLVGKKEKEEVKYGKGYEYKVNTKGKENSKGYEYKVNTERKGKSDER